MSRNIVTNGHKDDNEAARERTAQEGKLLFTKYRDKDCAILFKGSRVLAMQALSSKRNRIGAVYVGKIKNIAKNIEACFVEIAEGEICFLPMKDARFPLVCGRSFDFQKDKLREGDELLVQLNREAQKTKQAAVTAHISLSNEVAAVSLGAFHIGYSGKLSEEDRERLSGWVNQMRLKERDSLLTVKLSPEDNAPPVRVGLVVRTRAGECTEEEFSSGVTTLLTEFTALCRTALHRTCFSCVREAPPAFAAVLDKLAYPGEYQEIVTDDPEYFQPLKTYCAQKLPEKPVRLYEDAQLPLSKLYSLETKCKAAFERVVWLKSGAYLVIEPTEALTVIDVNSGKYEAGKGLLDSAYTVNCEAAEEVALQLRLRNLSGIIVVDFINMTRKEDPERLLSLLRNLVQKDRQKTNVVDMTQLGLVEITRKKDEPPLKEQFEAKK